MSETGLKMSERITILGRMTGMTAIGLAATTVSGCINVSAPEKPIQINLNISVTQDVVFRLDGEAKSLIQQNPGIF